VKFLIVEWTTTVPNWRSKRAALIKAIRKQPGECAGIHIADWA
jgi:hypothetical protein